MKNMSTKKNLTLVLKEENKVFSIYNLQRLTCFSL